MFIFVATILERISSFVWINLLQTENDQICKMEEKQKALGEVQTSYLLIIVLMHRPLHHKICYSKAKYVMSE